jgi:predicted RNase H-like nuclease
MAPNAPFATPWKSYCETRYQGYPGGQALPRPAALGETPSDHTSSVKPRARRPIVGVDGCRRGWVAVAENVAEKVCGAVYERFEDLLADLPSARVIAVDVPIGLPAKGARDCDLQARRRLGPRRSSVFPVPIRPVLEATTPEEASRIRNDVEGKRMSLQAFGILRKVREIDRLLVQSRALRELVIEVHPEVSFALWRGEPMQHSKRRAEGRAERRRLIAESWGERLEDCETSIRGKGCAIDDLYDAFAALWSARRVVSGHAMEIPESRVFDVHGIPMRIVA